MNITYKSNQNLVKEGKGWIALHRELLEKPIWTKSNPKRKVILITLLLMANHSENEWEWQGRKFKVKPGQFVTSLQSIKDAAGKDISIQNIRSALAKFENLGFLTNQSTNTERLITLVNWESYQYPEKNQQSNQQAPNKVPTTNNNDNNDNNDFFNLTKVVDLSKMDEEQKRKRMILIHNELKNSGVWLEDVGRITKTTGSETWSIVKTFLDEVKATEEYFKTLSEIKKHCVHWIRKYKPALSTSK